jgi:hypothetical protein
MYKKPSVFLNCDSVSSHFCRCYEFCCSWGTCIERWGLGGAVHRMCYLQVCFYEHRASGNWWHKWITFLLGQRAPSDAVPVATLRTWIDCILCVILPLVAGWQTNCEVQHVVRLARIMPLEIWVRCPPSVIATWMRVVKSRSWRFCFTGNRNSLSVRLKDDAVHCDWHETNDAVWGKSICEALLISRTEGRHFYWLTARVSVRLGFIHTHCSINQVCRIKLNDVSPKSYVHGITGTVGFCLT